MDFWLLLWLGSAIIVFVVQFRFWRSFLVADRPTRQQRSIARRQAVARAWKRIMGRDAE